MAVRSVSLSLIWKLSWQMIFNHWTNTINQWHWCFLLCLLIFSCCGDSYSYISVFWVLFCYIKSCCQVDVYFFSLSQKQHCLSCCNMFDQDEVEEGLAPTFGSVTELQPGTRSPAYEMSLMLCILHMLFFSLCSLIFSSLSEWIYFFWFVLYFQVFNSFHISFVYIFLFNLLASTIISLVFFRCKKLSVVIDSQTFSCIHLELYIYIDIDKPMVPHVMWTKSEAEYNQIKHYSVKNTSKGHFSHSFFSLHVFSSCLFSIPLIFGVFWNYSTHKGAKAPDIRQILWIH